jgi:hypothetical protein
MTTRRAPSLFFTTLRFFERTLPSNAASSDDCSRHLRRAADVEGTHGQLRARLADRLRGDDADRFADVDRRAAREVAAVALAADAPWLRRSAPNGSSPVDAGRRCLDRGLVDQVPAATMILPVVRVT